MPGNLGCRFLEIDGVVHHYLVEGLESGPTLVFVNSLGTDLRIWDAVACSFLRHLRIVRYDKRGHGLTDAPSAPYIIDDYVRDLTELLDRVTIRDAVVCGVSVGGMIAQAMAAAHPERVCALVLCDTASKIGSPAMWEERIEAVKKTGLGRMAGALMERWFTREFRQSRVAELHGYVNMLARTSPEGYIGACCALRDADLRESARAITQPALVVCGDQDVATPPDVVRSLAERIPVAQFSLVNGAAHLPCIEQPAALAQRMMQFFKEKGIVQQSTQ